MPILRSRTCLRALLGLAISLTARAVAAQSAATPPAAVIHTQRLKQLGDSLTPGAYRTMQLGRGPNFTYAITHRDTSSGLERHDAWTDVLVIQSGSATLLTGGAQDGATESSPGEWRGGTVRGATRQAIRAGDIVTTPAGTPHQMVLSKSERITYVVFKIAAPKPGERGAP